MVNPEMFAPLLKPGVHSIVSCSPCGLGARTSLGGGALGFLLLGFLEGAQAGNLLALLLQLLQPRLLLLRLGRRCRLFLLRERRRGLVL